MGAVARVAVDIDTVDLPVAVICRWDDHCHVGPGTWVACADLDDVGPVAVLTAGWLLRRTPTTVTVTQSVTADNDATGVFVILRSTIHWLTVV